MVSSAVQIATTFAGWSFLPDIATRQLLRILHQLSIRFLRATPPAPGTPTYVQHYRYTYATVVLAYLLYNLADGVLSVESNLYEVLGVGPAADDAGLKAAFRQFARRNHPDRPGVGAEGAEAFMRVRDAFDALKDPVVRFAYDRFGPDALAWKGCSTPREYLQRGLMNASMYHVVTVVGLFFWSAIGRPSPVAFWRYLFYVALLVLELALLVAPSQTPIPTDALSAGLAVPPASGIRLLHTLFPRRVAYQHVLLLHQLFVFLSIASSKVAPTLFPATPEYDAQAAEAVRLLAGMADREAATILHTELHAIHPPPAAPRAHPSLAHIPPLAAPAPPVLARLATEMEDMIIEANLKREAGPLRGAWEAAIARIPPDTPQDDGLGRLLPAKTEARRLGPLPSPPPEAPRRRHVRARSVSY